MADTSLFSLAHMLAEQEAIRVQINVLTGKDQALDRLIEAARAYEAVRAEVTSGVSQPELTRQAETVSEPEVAETVSAPVPSPRARVRTRNPRPAPVMQATEAAVAQLLETMGEPLQTGQFLDLLATEELNLPEHNPLNVLSARLSNSSKFQGRRGKGWWFADRPWPGEEDSTSGGANESRALNGDDPASAPDSGGLAPDRFVEELGEPSTSDSQPGSEGHEERKEERDVEHHPDNIR